eukprot:6189507-Pleurochrysis_carterae.AAC.2
MAVRGDLGVDEPLLSPTRAGAVAVSETAAAAATADSTRPRGTSRQVGRYRYAAWAHMVAGLASAAEKGERADLALARGLRQWLRLR